MLTLAKARPHKTYPPRHPIAPLSLTHKYGKYHVPLISPVNTVKVPVSAPSMINLSRTSLFASKGAVIISLSNLISLDLDTYNKVTFQGLFISYGLFY